MGNSHATSPSERRCSNGFLAVSNKLNRPMSDTDLFRGKKTSAQQQREAMTPSTRPRRTNSVRGYEPRSASLRRKRSILRRSHLFEGGRAARRKTIEMEAEVKMAADQKQLFEAAERGDVDAVEALADAGIDVNSADDNQMSVLHHAAMNARDEVMKALISRGANVNATDLKGGFSPMHWVVISANPQVSPSTDHVDRSLVILSKAGANVDCTDFNLATPLHIAAQKGDRGCIDALIRLGANPNLKDVMGRNCYEVAKNSQVRGFMEQLKKSKEEAIYHVLEITPFCPHSFSFHTPPPSYSPPPPPTISFPPLPPPTQYSNSQDEDVPEPLYHDPAPLRASMVSPPSTPPPPPPRRRKQQDPSFPLGSHINHVLEIPPAVTRRGSQKSSLRRRKVSVRRL